MSRTPAALAGGVQPNPNWGIIRDLRLPLPSLEEQHEVLRVIQVALSWIDRLTSEAVSARKLVDHLNQGLAKAFRGELAPQIRTMKPRACCWRGSGRNALLRKARKS
jgi:type I restriction enzyme S subunit